MLRRLYNYKFASEIDSNGFVWAKSAVIRYRAYICTVQKRYKKAIHFFQRFLSNFDDPMDKVTTYYDIGICYSNLESFDEAINYQQKAISIEPNAYLSYCALGDIYMRQEKLTEARQSYLKSILYKDDGLVKCNLGIIADKLGNKPEAEMYLKNSIEMDRTNVIPYYNLYHFYQRNNRLAEMDDVLYNAIYLFFRTIIWYLQIFACVSLTPIAKSISGKL